MRELLFAIVTSAILTFGKFIFHLFGVCASPTFKDFLWGGIGVFAFLFGYRIVYTVVTLIRYKRYPTFKKANQIMGTSWRDWKRLHDENEKSL